LLDTILHETAYAYELRGPRRRQARENLKKLRAMIRRAQNRGYATLARIADHLERLAVGDESNAAIDAVDASVAIADYQSEADEDARARDREETKRLLYVALTRARDRLYLSAA